MSILRNALFAAGVFLSQFAYAELAVVAHRGFSMYYPENTIPAYAACKDLGHLFEIDLRKTSDGRFVSFHDDTLARTTRDTGGNPGAGSVETKTLAELRTLDAGSWFAARFAGTKIPTFEEIVLCARENNLKICIERKGSTVTVADLQALLVTNECADIVAVQSFDYAFAKSFKAAMPLVYSGYLVDAATAVANVATYKADKIDFASCNALNATQVAALHAGGVDVYAWTINGKSNIEAHIAMGIDGIITDDPATAMGKDPVDPPVPYVPGTIGNALVSYWALDGNGIDYKGVQPGTATGTPTWIAGKFGQALSPASGKYVNIPTTAASTPTSNSVTVSAWIKLDLSPTEQAVNYAGVFDAAADGYVMYSDKPSNEFRFKVTTASGLAARPGIGGAYLTKDVWHHVVGVYDGNKEVGGGMSSIYFNGNKVSQLPLNTVPSDLVRAQQSGIGADPSGPTTTYFAGAVDDVAMWNRALTNGDIEELYKRGIEGTSLGDFLVGSCVSDWSQH